MIPKLIDPSPSAFKNSAVLNARKKFYFIRLEFIELITSDKLFVIFNHINASPMLVTDVADDLYW